MRNSLWLLGNYSYGILFHAYVLFFLQVIDPDIPPEGISVQGEKIKAPSDEVLELQAKNPMATYLVRFFDGRRTWYV